MSENLIEIFEPPFIKLRLRSIHYDLLFFKNFICEGLLCDNFYALRVL